MSDYVAAADRELDAALDEPMTLGEYADHVVEHPLAAAHAPKYLLAAIESRGTRTVVEEGEERVRYRFFDDPASDGEHAVLGNTDVLNGFVADLRAVAAGRAKTEKICWFSGPTATGKSEFKRCLVDGLRAFSRTPAGRRYTLEWNVAGTSGSDPMTYGDGAPERDANWEESPVQVNPLAAFPPAVRERVLDDAAANDDGDAVPSRVEADLDPFSREAYDYLADRYRERAHDDLFSRVTDAAHCRVTNYVMDVGRGIGVLHAEDAGSPKERLVGSWMPEMLSRLDSRGRKNPQAFSYDGVLSQGNGGVTVVEDASQHADLLRKLLNVPDERAVKLDKGIGMDVDTQLLVISNPDLEAQLDQHAERSQADPLKALKRRLDRHEFGYLTNYSLETQLLRRELLGETDVWDDAERERVEARVAAGATVPVRRDPGEPAETVELAPHALEAAAMYSVVTRLDAEALPPSLDLVDVAVLYDRGFLREGDEERTREDYDVGGGRDGEAGIPVTYTRDALAELLADPPERHHAEVDVSGVLTPDDVLDAMASGLADAPVFSTAEATEYEGRVVLAKDYAFAAQEDDVIEALTHDVTVDEDTVAEYVEHVYAWATDGTVETPRGAEAPDPLLLKVFETEHLGRFGEGDYDGTDALAAVAEFRTDKVVTALNRHAWERRDEGFHAGDVDLAEIPAVTAVLDATDWEDVRRRYPALDPAQWADPPEETRTAELKAKALTYLVDERGYTRASAELASTAVMEGVSHRWG
ncbi:kinase anchor protein [Halarchaeum sp. CBA1220]|uniref:kinase anchor protein n=1 Tax=Halarchaeum sp. CBA1220 TaxID=1853682 RepID=UPI0015A2B0EF|nr:kinase anchor protein [Halarchaeum sp. CBA1220]